MAYIYNHRSQSLSMPMTYPEFAVAHGGGIGTLGTKLHATIGARGHYGVYRHEFAHFASYNATGLMEFHSLFLDYRLYLHQRFLFFCLKQKGHPPTFPIIHADSTFEVEVCSAFRAANEQVRSIEGYLFGYGTTKSVEELFDWQVQETFLRLIGDDIAMAHPNVFRTRMVYHQILLTTDPDVAGDAKVMHPLVTDPHTPDGPPLRITARAVLEAYAITIEVVAKYRKALIINPKGGIHPPVRLPAKIDTVALEACFDLWPERRFTVDDFLAGHAPSEVYWCVALVTFAAMMVPVAADRAGDTCVMGSLSQLSVATRFAQLLHLIEQGVIRHPRESYDATSRVGGDDRNPGIQRWLIDSLQAIGDPWSFKIAKRVAKFVMSGGHDHRELLAPKRSQDTISKIARCDLYMETYGFISEGGIWSNSAPKYIITADKVILANMSGVKQEDIFMYFASDSILELLEAMADHRSWDITWDRLAIAENLRKSAVIMALTIISGTKESSNVSNVELLF